MIDALSDNQRNALSKELAGGVHATRFADIAPERVDWLWALRIPRRGLSLVVGDPGLGKSMLTCDLAARVSRGELGDRGSVLLLSAEDSSSAVVRPRLEAAGADLGVVHNVSLERTASRRASSCLTTFRT